MGAVTIILDGNRITHQYSNKGNVQFAWHLREKKKGGKKGFWLNTTCEKIVSVGKEK